MATKLIRLKNGLLVEAEVPENRARPISGGFADQVDSNIDKVRSVLVAVCQPVLEAWREMNQEISVEQAEVEVGLSFEGEGNLFVTRSKVGANFTVKLVLKARDAAQTPVPGLSRAQGSASSGDQEPS